MATDKPMTPLEVLRAAIRTAMFEAFDGGVSLDVIDRESSWTVRTTMRDLVQEQRKVNT